MADLQCPPPVSLQIFSWNLLLYFSFVMGSALSLFSLLLPSCSQAITEVDPRGGERGEAGGTWGRRVHQLC